MDDVLKLGFLGGLQRAGIVPGLDRMRALVERLGHPQSRYPVIIVTGTNGKGSTTCFIDSILRAAGFRTGRFTSPHLHDIRERIVLSGENVDADRFIDEVLSVAGGVAEEVVARLPEGERAAVVSGVDAAVAVAAQNLGLGVRARAELRRGALEQQLAARYGVMFLVPETAVRPGNRRLRWQSPCPAAGEKAQ